LVKNELGNIDCDSREGCKPSHDSGKAGFEGGEYSEIVAETDDRAWRQRGPAYIVAEREHCIRTRSHSAKPIMGFSAHRLAKVARTTCAPFTAVLAFSVLLTIIFVLYQPTRGPGDLQKLGWQSWATVSSKPATDGNVAIDNTTTQGDETGSDNVPPGTDWWDVETPEPEIESSSLPLDVWDPLMPHDTGCKRNVLYHSKFRSWSIPDSN